MQQSSCFDGCRRTARRLFFCFVSALAAHYPAQAADGVIPVTAEPDHKIRFDNGRVRMYEVVLPAGKGTLMHEHRADSFAVFFRNAERTNEPYGGKPTVANGTAGLVTFTSTAKGPYSHRIVASGNATFHVIAMELLAAAPHGPATTTRRSGSAFNVTLESPRGRVYRATLAPGESTGAFTRPAGTAVFAIAPGRISETVAGMAPRLWDFERGHFRWIDTAESLSLRNEGALPVDLVEIEVF